MQLNPEYIKYLDKAKKPFRWSKFSKFKITETHDNYVQVVSVSPKGTGADELPYYTERAEGYFICNWPDHKIDDLFLCKTPVDKDQYPDKCIVCGEPAVLVFNLYKCSNRDCTNWESPKS